MVGEHSRTAETYVRKSSQEKRWDIPPVRARPFPNVCKTVSMRSSRPRADTSPRPCFPYSPVEWASSTTICPHPAGTSSSTLRTISGRGAKSPSMLYKLSKATKTVAFPAAIAGCALKTCRRVSRKDVAELWEKGYRAVRARDATRPSRVEAWMSSSRITASPACGTECQNATFASYPELKRSAAGARKKVFIRCSNSKCADVFPFRRRDPPVPKTRGSLEILSRNAWRR